MRRLLVVALLAAPLPAAAASEPDCDWPTYGRDAGRSFAVPEACSEVTVSTAPRMRPKWVVPTHDSVTASAAVVDGVVYVGAWDGTFYALDADDGTEHWTFEVDDANQVSFGRIVSSATVAEVAGTRVVIFGGGSTLYVLDAATGAELTRACLDPRTDPDPPADPVRCRGSDADIEIESSPVVVEVDGETWVLVGHSVHNRAGVGRTGLVALRLSAWDLEALWKLDPETALTYTTDPAKAGEPGFVHVTDPLTHDAGAGSGCGGVWSSPAVDVRRELVVFGTANCTADTMPPGEIGGEAVWTAGLRDGGAVWSYAPRGLNDFDDDFGASPTLLPGGRVGIGGKDGRYYAFDLEGDGEPLWVSQAGQPGRLAPDFSVGGMIGTAAVGEVDGEPAVFATTALSTPFAEPVGGPQSVDTSLASDPGRMLSLHAISAVDGRVLWRSPLARQSYGAPVYSRGVVLVPSTFGLALKAFHADTGLPLASLPLNGAPSSTPVVVGDRVYLGAGTRTTDAEYKAFGAGGAEPALGAHALSPASGIWAFEIVS